MQQIEAELIALLTEQGHVDLDNKALPKRPAMSEEDLALADGFLHEILLMLPLLGFRHLVSDTESEDFDITDEPPSPVYISRSKAVAVYNKLPRDKEFSRAFMEASASLKAVEGGVAVLKGSTVVAEPSASFAQGVPYYAALRRQLVDAGVIVDEEGRKVFSDNQFFLSASAAAAVVRGRAPNADRWVASDGTILGDLLRKIREQA